MHSYVVELTKASSHTASMNYSNFEFTISVVRPSAPSLTSITLPTSAFTRVDMSVRYVKPERVTRKDGPTVVWKSTSALAWSVSRLISHDEGAQLTNTRGKDFRPSE